MTLAERQKGIGRIKGIKNTHAGLVSMHRMNIQKNGSKEIPINANPRCLNMY